MLLLCDRPLRGRVHRGLRRLQRPARDAVPRARARARLRVPRGRIRRDRAPARRERGARRTTTRPSSTNRIERELRRLSAKRRALHAGAGSSSATGALSAAAPRGRADRAGRLARARRSISRSFVETPWYAAGGSSATTARRCAPMTSRRRTSTPPTPRAPTASSSRAPLVVVRLPARQSSCPRAARAGRRRGILAYSKICTHAGCAISLYRTPTFPALEPGPALVCPCHYSTFDPATRRHGPLRAGRAAAAAAPARDRRRRSASRRRQLQRASRAVVVGRPLEEADMISAVVRWLDRGPRRHRCCGQGCVTSSRTTGRSCSARSRSTRSSSSSRPGSTSSSSSRTRPR